MSVLLAVVAGVLLLPARADLALPGHRPSMGRRSWPLLGTGGIVALILLGLDGSQLLLALILMAAAGGTWVLVARQHAERSSLAREGVVVELAEALVGELRAGQPVQVALDRCAELWPEFSMVAAAGRLGADVPAAMRRLGALPGAAGLMEIAAAWQVSLRSGAALALALTQVAESTRARRATRHLVTGELSSARATARLVAVLPFASLSMATGFGGPPWHFLLATPAGLGCLALGVALVFTAQLWIDEIARRALAR